MWNIVVCGLLALFSTMGLLAVGWLMFGRFLRPVGRRMWVVLPASGGGDGLEQELSGLRWLSAAGLARFRVVILDRGLDREGLRLVCFLKDRWPELTLCRRSELERVLHARED